VHQTAGICADYHFRPGFGDLFELALAYSVREERKKRTERTPEPAAWQRQGDFFSFDSSRLINQRKRGL
jgi:hypothetical protein